MFRISKIQTFESNSQRGTDIIQLRSSCSEYQRYKLLKAIHNAANNILKFALVVQNIKDTNFWKQFTTYFFIYNHSKCCSEYQRYKLLKAIHNHIYIVLYFKLVVQNIKDTNFWKQFTTSWFWGNGGEWLFRISKIQTFESNSQQKNRKTP